MKTQRDWTRESRHRWLDRIMDAEESLDRAEHAIDDKKMPLSHKMAYAFVELGTSEIFLARGEDLRPLLAQLRKLEEEECVVEVASPPA